VKLIKIAAIEEIDTKEKASTHTIAGILSQLEGALLEEGQPP
jgi:hypothetical protein